MAEEIPPENKKQVHALLSRIERETLSFIRKYENKDPPESAFMEVLKSLVELVPLLHFKDCICQVKDMSIYLCPLRAYQDTVLVDLRLSVDGEGKLWLMEVPCTQRLPEGIDSLMRKFFVEMGHREEVDLKKLLEHGLTPMPIVKSIHRTAFKMSMEVEATQPRASA